MLSIRPIVPMVTLPEWLTGSPAIQQSGWSLTASVRIAQVTLFLPENHFVLPKPPE